MRFRGTPVVLVALAALIPITSNAQLNSKIGSTVTDTARQSTSGATRLNLAAPKITSVNPQRIYPTADVALAGTDIMNATEVQIRVGCIVASDGNVSCGNPSATFTALLQDATSTSAKFSMPFVPGIGDGAPIVLQLAAGRNVGTFASGLALDARPVITGVRNSTLKAGESLYLDGRNLNRVTSVRIGSISVPAIVHAGALSLHATMPLNCEPSGSLTVEETPGPATWPSTSTTAAPSYVANQSAVSTITCYGGTRVTGASPLSGKAGTNVTLFGTGFSAVTDVPGFTWSRQSDQQITLVLPDKGNPPYSSESQITGVVWVSNVLGGAPIPTLRVLTPPKITDVGPTTQKNGVPEVIVEPGEQVYVSGYGLSSPPYLNPTMRIGSTNLIIMSITPTQIKGAIPYGTPPGPLTVSHEGGSITTPNSIWLLSGDTRIEEIDAATAAPGDVVTVRGQNLFRIYGICATASDFAPIINEAKTEHPWSNTSASFIVPSTWTDKVTLGVRVNSGGQMVCLQTQQVLEIKR